MTGEAWGEDGDGSSRTSPRDEMKLRSHSNALEPLWHRTTSTQGSVQRSTHPSRSAQGRPLKPLSLGQDDPDPPVSGRMGGYLPGLCTALATPRSCPTPRLPAQTRCFLTWFLMFIFNHVLFQCDRLLYAFHHPTVSAFGSGVLSAPALGLSRGEAATWGASPWS